MRISLKHRAAAARSLPDRAAGASSLRPFGFARRYLLRTVSA
jgi:hypothetical protein